jgi:hypothetical protein
MANGCNSCEHYVPGVINIYAPDTPRKCAIEKDVEFAKWWEDNSHKTDKSTLTDMKCHVKTKLAVMVDESIAILDKIRALVSNENTDGI